MAETQTEALLYGNGPELSVDIPDITKLSLLDRKKLLKQLLELEEKENTLIQVLNINEFETTQHKLSTLLPRYSSKSILLWFIVSCIVSTLFSLYPIFCLLFQDTNHWYCSDPLLDSTASILQFILTFLMTTSVIIATYYILLHKNKKHIDALIHCRADDNLYGFLTINKDLLSYINTMSKWYIWWIMSSFCFLYLSSLLILIIASIRGKKLFADILSQNVVYAVPFTFGPIIIITVYLPLYIMFFSMFLYGKLCKVIADIGVRQNKKSNQDLYPLLLRFRDYMLCFRFFMIFITISCGICVAMCGWNLFVLMGAIFGLKTNKFEIWYLLWGIIGICASVVTLLCRLRLYRVFGNISLVINKNILPLQIQCYIANSKVNIEHNTDQKWKTFWNKYEKLINNTHSVLSLLAFVIFFNFMITDGVVEVTAYIFVTSGILLCCGNLVLQIFLFDKHNRTKILYKTLLLLITMFFIIRCNYFKNKADSDSKQHHFVIFKTIFNILAAFGLLFIFTISIKRELFGYILQIDGNVMLLFEELIVGKYKYLILEITFSASITNTLLALLWCIIYANNNDSNQLYFLYSFIWILPTFYWHNEIVQYLTVYIDRYNNNKGDERNQHLVSFGLIQIFQPIVVIALCISFSYLIRFGINELGSTPIVFCGIQLFIIIPSFVIALWH